MERKRGVDGRFVAVRRVRERLLAVLADPSSDAMDEVALAHKAGIGVDVLDDVLDEGLVREAMARRGEAIRPEEMAEVDRAMLARAREGHVGAARLLYARMAARDEADDGSLPSVEELEEMVALLRGD